MESQADGETATETEDSSSPKSLLQKEMEDCLGLRDLAEEHRETNPELSQIYMEQFRREHRRIAYKIRWGERKPSLIEWVAQVQRRLQSERPESEVSSPLQEKRQEFYKLMNQYDAQLVAEAKAATYEYMKARIAKKQTGPSEAWKIEQRGTVAVKLIEMNIPVDYAGIWMRLAEPFIQKGVSGLKALKAAIKMQKKPNGLIDEQRSKAGSMCKSI
jgi:hypothetical protein